MLNYNAFQESGDVFGVVQDEDFETEGAEQRVTVELERAGFLTRGFELHKGEAPARQQDDPVRDTAHAGAHELEAEAAQIADGADEFLFYGFF